MSDRSCAESWARIGHATSHCCAIWTLLATLSGRPATRRPRRQNWHRVRDEEYLSLCGRLLAPPSGPPRGLGRVVHPDNDHPRPEPFHLKLLLPVIMKVRILSSTVSHGCCHGCLALASRGELKGWASEESGKALVGGEPDEPIDAACARQPLELVLASVL
jgi:hypothetical protein